MLFFKVNKRKKKRKKQKLRVYIFGRDMLSKIEGYNYRNKAPTDNR
jgi:hypothetical protein